MSDETRSAGELIHVGTFPDPASAQVALAALEAAGISGFLQGENANGLIPIAFSARLLVASENESAARDILASAEFTPASEADVLAAEIADERTVE